MPAELKSRAYFWTIIVILNNNFLDNEKCYFAIGLKNFSFFYLGQLRKLSSDIFLLVCRSLLKTLFSLLVNMSHACFWHSTRRLIRLARKPAILKELIPRESFERAKEPLWRTYESMCARHFWSPYLQTHWEAPLERERERKREIGRAG